MWADVCHVASIGRSVNPSERVDASRPLAYIRTHVFNNICLQENKDQFSLEIGSSPLQVGSHPAVLPDE